MAASTPPTHSDSPPPSGDSFAHVDDSGPLPHPYDRVPYQGGDSYAGYTAEGAAQGAAPPGTQPEALPQPAMMPGSLTPWSGDGSYSQYMQPQPAAMQFSAGQGQPQPMAPGPPGQWQPQPGAGPFYIGPPQGNWPPDPPTPPGQLSARDMQQVRRVAQEAQQM